MINPFLPVVFPFHHKVEKWATTQLTEKNKEIQLAAAEKNYSRDRHYSYKRIISKWKKK
jgi:hypothetical protein